MFYSFWLDDSKQDASTTTANRKRWIEVLKKQKVLMSALSTIWENTDGFAEQYICASALYLMSVMPQYYLFIIDQGISEPVHGKGVVGGLNAIGKCYIYQLLSNVKIQGSKHLINIF